MSNVGMGCLEYWQCFPLSVRCHACLHWTRQDDRLSDEAVCAALVKCSEAGITRLAVNGCHPGDWDRVQDIVSRHGASHGLIANYGLHPWWIDRRGTSWLDDLRRRLEAAPTAGLGEVLIWKALVLLLIHCAAINRTRANAAPRSLLSSAPVWARQAAPRRRRHGLADGAAARPISVGRGTTAHRIGA